jgi:hypothetical protein
MIDLFIMYGGIVALALIISGCSRILSHSHDDAAYQVEAVSDGEECRATIGVEKVRGDDGDNFEVNNPMQ